jgi:DNA polymerase-4
MAWLGHFTPLVEPNSIDEAWLDITGCAPLFGTPVETATRIRDEIRDILGLWCSIGIAENKFLAKMASELIKPLGITEIWPDDLAGKLWPLPVRAMYGVGAKTADKLQTVGIRSIGDLAAIDPAFLVSLLGKGGHELSRHARGLDDEPVRPHDAGAMKSVGRSTTLVTDLSDLDQAKRVLLALADDVGRSLRRYDKKGHTVQLTLKSADFQVMTRQTSVALTSATQEIYQAGCSLLEQNWRAAKPVRLIGISVSGFDTPGLYDQISLADLAGQTSGRRQQTGHDRIDRAMDAIRNRYGKDKITYGKLVSTDKERLELHGQDISDTGHPEREQNERFTGS